MNRLPNESSCAYGPKTEVKSTRARLPLECVSIESFPGATIPLRAARRDVSETTLQNYYIRAAGPRREPRGAIAGRVRRCTPESAADPALPKVTSPAEHEDRRATVRELGWRPAYSEDRINKLIGQGFTNIVFKIGIAAGSGSEGAMQSAVRDALAEGVSRDEIRHSITMMGSRTVKRQLAGRKMRCAKNEGVRNTGAVCDRPCVICREPAWSDSRVPSSWSLRQPCRPGL